MALTPQEIQELKKQLSSQIQHLPEDQREEAQQQIDEMSPEALELMLNQQKTKQPEKNIMRLIVNGSLPSKKIDANKYALAVLDIRPVSQGHVLIIPLSAVTAKQQVPTQAFTLAKKIAKRMKSKLAPEGIEIQTETKFKEQVINVIPCYEKPLSITSPRYEATAEELDKMQKRLAAKERKPRVKKQAVKQEPSQKKDTIILKHRIP
ncbi:MAG: HIT domain-containing protein [Nanoarchaeota archaeon]